MKYFRAIREKLVTRLLQSIYSLRYSGRLWNQKVVAFVIDLSFVAFNADPNILIRHNEDHIIMVSIYIDKYLLISKSQKGLDWIKKKL